MIHPKTLLQWAKVIRVLLRLTWVWTVAGRVLWFNPHAYKITQYKIQLLQDRMFARYIIIYP